MAEVEGVWHSRGGDGQVKDWCGEAAEEQRCPLTSPGSAGTHRAASLLSEPSCACTPTTLPPGDAAPTEGKGLEAARPVKTFGPSTLSPAKPRRSLLLQDAEGPASFP